MKARGDVFDLGWGELISMLLPGSGYYLEPLSRTGNPYMSIENRRLTPADLDAGQSLYRANCSNCHGGEGEGGVGADLTGDSMQYGDTDWGMYRAITRGIPGTSMTSQPVSDVETWQIIAYVRSLATPASSPGLAASIQSVSAESLLAGRRQPDSWLSYSGDYDGKRFSNLDEINSGNADRLSLLWLYQAESSDPYLETSPIVHGNRMYVTSSPGSVHALDATTGEEI